MKAEARKIKISKEEEKVAIEEIIQFFENERDEKIGNMESMLLFEFFMEKIGPSVYNQAIADAHKYMNNKVEDLYGLMF